MTKYTIQCHYSGCPKSRGPWCLSCALSTNILTPFERVKMRLFFLWLPNVAIPQNWFCHGLAFSTRLLLYDVTFYTMSPFPQCHLFHNVTFSTTSPFLWRCLFHNVAFSTTSLFSHHCFFHDIASNIFPQCCFFHDIAFSTTLLFPTSLFPKIDFSVL